MAELILTFNEDGTVSKETKGFVGKSCIEKTKFIEDALGKAKNRRLKSEYYDEADQETDKEKLTY